MTKTPSPQKPSSTKEVPEKKQKPFRARMYEIIFEADTRAGKLFDVLLLIAIVFSVLVVILDSVDSIHARYEGFMNNMEWLFTILFTVEYIARICCAPRPLRYIFSFYGMVDLLSIMPTYLSLFLPKGSERITQLTVMRAMRLMRVFRVFKLGHMLSEASALRQAIWAARAKITVFLTFVIIAVVIVGAAMHLVEEENEGFASIPQSMYWAVVTMTTVGYGDSAPTTALGKGLAACMMILGYCFIIVPTSIVSAELANAGQKKITTQVCPECMSEGHDYDARHCKYCGGKI